MTYSFTDRASYLEAFTMWKADYNGIVASIRKGKQDFKDANRTFSKSGGDKPYDYQSNQGMKDVYWAAHTAMEDLRSSLKRLRIEANEMVSIRHEMKETAQVQYLSSKAV